jgi:7,8-dihydro-6-hydroxymethylpterin-pyrophosphokinase
VEKERDRQASKQKDISEKRKEKQDPESAFYLANRARLTSQEPFVNAVCVVAMVAGQ